MKKYLFLSCLFLLSCSDKPKDIFFILYKTKQDYSKNIYFKLSSDKKLATVQPTPRSLNSVHLAKKITNDYFLSDPGVNGINYDRVVTSLTNDTYTELLPHDSIIKLIIDYDPFIEYYIPATTKAQNQMIGSNGIDTAKIIDIINKNQFNDYFERLK